MTQLNSPDSQEALPCLMIPTQGKNIILPNVTVAEVVSFEDPEVVENAPKWFLGFIQWRGTQVPLISFELANSQIHGQNSGSARIAVLNGTTGNPRMPFFAMVIQGIPRMVRVSESDLQQEDTAVSQAESMVVKTVLGRAFVPNLEFLEGLLAKVI